MRKILILAFIAAAVTAAQDYRTPTRPKFDYTYSTSGEPFGFESRGEKAIEVNGVAICEYKLKSGKRISYKAGHLHTEYGERCPDIGFSFLTMWEPSSKTGRSRSWVCAYGWGSPNGYVFRFVRNDCPDYIVATSVGAWVEAGNFGRDFVPADFGDIPQARARYSKATLDTNPNFAKRVKYRASHGLISRVGDP